MRYSTLRETALPHRLIAGVTLAVLIISTGTAAALTATAVPSSGPYLITPKVVRDNNTFVLDAKVVDTRNSAVVAQPSVRVNAGSSASVSAQSGTTRVTIDFAIAQNGEGTALLRVAEDGLVVQETTHRLSAAQPARSAQYQGEPISIHFENADVRDVLARFGRVSGIEMVIDANVAGTVTRKIDNVPWDQALDEIIAANGLTYAVDGKKLRISKK